MPARPGLSSLPFALCAIAFAATAHAAFAPGDNLRSLQFGGLERIYRVYAPPGYDASAAVPLVVDTHGFGSNGQQQEGISGMQDVAAANGFLVAYPNGIRNAWNAGLCCGNRDIDDVGFYRALVEAIAGEAAIDRRRVYATGLSNGGAMSQRLACDAADVFAAAAPMAFPIPARPLSECQPSRSIPVLTVMGLTDVLVRYDGGGFPSAPDTFAYWRDVNACSGEPERVERGQSRCETYTTCANAVQVGLCSVTARSFGGSGVDGHLLYLNDDFVLAEVAWEFLSRFTVPDRAGTPAEADLAGSDRIKVDGVPRRGRLAPLRWRVRLGQGTWGASDGDQTVLSGSWRRRRGSRTGTLELTSDALGTLETLAQARIEEQSNTTGFLVGLEPAGQLRVRLGRGGAPVSLRGRFRILRGGVPSTAIGRYELRLNRAR